MPTPSGLPQRGEVWERRFKLPPDWEENVWRFTVRERGLGELWSMRVKLHEPGPHQDPNPLWVDCAYWFKQGELHYIGPEPKALP